MDRYELAHHGIKGMKWGVRRYQNKNGSLTNAGKKRYKNDADDEMKQMSDQELRAKINRLQMESQYKNLTKKPVSKGRKFVDGVLMASATAVATGYASQYMKTGAQWVGKQTINVAKQTINVAKKVIKR